MYAHMCISWGRCICISPGVGGGGLRTEVTGWPQLLVQLLRERAYSVIIVTFGGVLGLVAEGWRPG